MARKRKPDKPKTVSSVRTELIHIADSNIGIQFTEDKLTAMASEAGVGLLKRLPADYSVFVCIVRPDEVIGMSTNQYPHRLGQFLRRVAWLYENSPAMIQPMQPIDRG